MCFDVFTQHHTGGLTPDQYHRSFGPDFRADTWGIARNYGTDRKGRYQGWKHVRRWLSQCLAQHSERGDGLVLQRDRSDFARHCQVSHNRLLQEAVLCSFFLFFTTAAIIRIMTKHEFRITTNHEFRT